MSDPRVFEAIKYALGLASCDDPAELNRLGLKGNCDAEEIKSIAKQALQRLEHAHVQFSADERARAAKQIKLSARALLASVETGTPPPKAAEPATIPTEITNAAGATPSSVESSKPRLVAKPVDPAKLVAKVVTPPPAVNPTASDTSTLPSEEILFRPVPTTRRPRGAARPWLGWAMLGILLVSCGAAVSALFLFRDEPFFAFQSEPIQKPDPKSDLNKPHPNVGPKEDDATPDSNPAIVNNSNSKPENPVTTPPTNPPTTDPPTTDPPTTDPPTTDPPTTDPPTTDPPTTDPPVNEVTSVTSENPLSNDNLPNTDSNQSEPSTNPPVNQNDPGSNETMAVRRLAVLRQLDLSLIAIAAGQAKMAESCLARAKQAAGNEASFQNAVALVEQLHAWRAEINATVAARVPLLTNREELPVDDTMVSLISVSEKSLVVRAAGQRREYEATKLPWSIASSVLEVTNSNNTAEDNARKLIAKLLRRPENRTEQLTAMSAELQELLTSGVDSATYSTDALKILTAYFDAGLNLEQLCPRDASLTRIPVTTWAPWYRETEQRFKADRELRTAAKAPSTNRFELEDMVWINAAPANIESIARSQLMLFHIAMERKDLAYVVDNLARCEQILIIESDHSMWTDLGRMLLEPKPSDQELVRLLESVMAAQYGGTLGPSSMDGLKKVGKQLAQRLTDRNLKQGWLKKF
ncbi:MAG: hypothetical protein JNL67_02005 [Planctomycetaceae bacterium]|nr:hypothetical protein [Planctomycetaceae bacterium]